MASFPENSMSCQVRRDIGYPPLVSPCRTVSKRAWAPLQGERSQITRTALLAPEANARAAAQRRNRGLGSADPAPRPDPGVDASSARSSSPKCWIGSAGSAIPKSRLVAVTGVCSQHKHTAPGPTMPTYRVEFLAPLALLASLPCPTIGDRIKNNSGSRISVER